MDSDPGSGCRTLRRLGGDGAAALELLRHDGSGRPPRWPWRLPIPLPEEPQLEAWRRTVARSREVGAWRALVERFVQLRFPIREGIRGDPAYRAAVRRGAAPPPDASPLRPSDPGGIEIRLHASVAGRVPVIVARHRGDFETLVRALAMRNEPRPVPPAQGACLVAGLVDWERVARHRERWERERRGLHSGAGWAEEMRRLRARPALYQDRFVIATVGPYSGVAPPDGRAAEAWERLSLRIRLEHECTHYLAVRAFGRLRHDLLEELLADWVGLLRATGSYDPALALRFLGLEGEGIAPGGRLHVYRGDPPLSSGGFALLAGIARRGVEALARLTEALGDAAVDHAAQARVVLAASTLPEWALADRGFADRVLGLAEELAGRMWANGGVR